MGETDLQIQIVARKRQTFADSSLLLEIEAVEGAGSIRKLLILPESRRFLQKTADSGRSPWISPLKRGARVRAPLDNIQVV